MLLLEAGDGVAHGCAGGVQHVAEHILRQHGAGKNFTGDDFMFQGFIGYLLQAFGQVLIIFRHRRFPFFIINGILKKGSAEVIQQRDSSALY